MSLAIARQMLKFVWLAEYKISDEKPWGTLDWWAGKVPKATPERERFFIGEFNTY